MEAIPIPLRSIGKPHLHVVQEREMMQKDDIKFVQSLTDSHSRSKAISRWRRSRMCSFVAFACLGVAAISSFIGGQAAMCGLFSGVAAINFAVAVSTDSKIKIALLIDELKRD